MRRASPLAAVALALVGLALPARAASREEPDRTAQAGSDAPAAAEAQTPAAAKPSEPAAKPGPAPASSTPVPKPETAAPSHPPQDATAALLRAAAAYEYGDLNQVVEAARLVTEGLLPASQGQQAQALRWQGIGLYLTNRPLGAETAFTELLRKDPGARLDPTTTRPEVVAFFESLRHQQLARERSSRKMIWNFIPPVGQFQNDDDLKGWLLLSAGFVAGVTCAASYAVFQSWKLSNDQSTHPDTAESLKVVNAASGAVLIALYIYGVVDGLVGYSRPLDEARLPVSLHYFPGGGGLGFTF